ncbi:hypothetical protein DM460_22005, partial [Brevibacillus laterosporus]|uniref:hypothetical protein n=1 Tax=Brevibacillus laterosporus TaxID=1465 RepID=UPI000ED1A8E4
MRDSFLGETKSSSFLSYIVDGNRAMTQLDIFLHSYEFIKQFISKQKSNSDQLSCFSCTIMERVMGIEPTRPAWKAGV